MAGGPSRLVMSVLAGVAAFGLVLAACSGTDTPGRATRPVMPVSSSGTTASAPPAGPTSLPVESGSASVSPQVPEPPVGNRRFTLTLRGQRVSISANVAPYKAKRGADGAYEPVDPPHYGTAVWLVQAGFPTAPGAGTVYVYGHACHHHVCPFTTIQQHGDSYTVHNGDRITVTTATGALTYQVCAIGSSPKSGSLQVPGCGTQGSSDLVLVTCAYESGDISKDDIVVAASLIAATQR